MGLDTRKPVIGVGKPTLEVSNQAMLSFRDLSKNIDIFITASSVVILSSERITKGAEQTADVLCRVWSAPWLFTSNNMGFSCDQAQLCIQNSLRVRCCQLKLTFLCLNSRSCQFRCTLRVTFIRKSVFEVWMRLPFIRPMRLQNLIVLLKAFQVKSAYQKKNK